MDIDFIDNFLKQSQTDNLKTKGLYPESVYDLDVKVSFGMGAPTHVPWISTLGPGMSTSNGYYPVYLYYKKENILILAYGISETVEYEEPWTREIVESNQKIKDFLKNHLGMESRLFLKLMNQKLQKKKLNILERE